jgi:hypothetical protein
MNTNHYPAAATQPTLVLRRHSIRALTGSELRLAHGGYDAWGNQSGDGTGRTDGDDRNPRHN